MLVAVWLHGHELYAVFRQCRKLCHLHGISERALHLSPCQVDGQNKRVPHIVVQLAVQMQHAVLVFVCSLGKIEQVGRLLVENQLRVASRSGIIQFEVVYGSQLIGGYSRLSVGCRVYVEAYAERNRILVRYFVPIQGFVETYLHLVLILSLEEGMSDTGFIVCIAKRLGISLTDTVEGCC